MDRILPTLLEDASSDVPIIQGETSAYIAAILHWHKPQSLKPEEAAQLLALLNTKATPQEPDPDLRNSTALLLRELADVNRDRKVDCADMAVVQSAMGTKDGEVGFDARADINMDRVVDEKDLAYVGVRLSVGLRCLAAR